MLLDKVADPDKVLAPVGGGDDGLLLPDPGLLILHVAEELLHGQGLAQPPLAVGQRLEQVVVSLLEGNLLCLDVVRVEVAGLAELLGGDADAVDPVL